jgi:hypothetical protein
VVKKSHEWWWHLNARSSQKTGVRGIKVSQNMTIHKLMIHKHENISVMVFNGMTVTGWNLSGWSQDAQWMLEGGERKNLAKKEVTFNCLAFLYMLLYTSSHGAMTGSISIFQWYENSPFHLFEEGATIYTVNFCTWWSTGPDVSPDFVFIFFYETNHWFPTMASD